jgi:hypothetical protein
MLTVFILGFGTASYSLMHGAEEFSWHLPRKIVNVAFWHIFGEVNTLDAFERKEKNYYFCFEVMDFLPLDNFSANGYIVFTLYVIYMVLVSILLVNLLIAMFGY